MSRFFTPICHAMRLTLLILLLFSSSGSAADTPQPGFQILSAETSLSKGYYHLDADIALHFSDESLRALDSGVPITIQIEIEILRQREYLWDENIHEVTLRYQMLYHHLTKRHVVTDLLTGARTSFRSRHAAINALGSLEGTSILDSDLLNADDTYIGRMRCSVDIEALPAPLRIPAYLSKEWRLQSDWFVWPL